jgi:hypothetical protein
MAKAKKAKIPLNEILGAMDRNNWEYYRNLPEELQEEFSPFVMMRYASNVRSKEFYGHYITMVNDLCNVNFDVLSKHPELFWQLLSLSGVGKSQFHAWLPPGKKAKKSKVQEFLYKMHPTYKLEDLEMLESINTKEQIQDMMREYGYDDKEIKEIFK